MAKLKLKAGSRPPWVGLAAAIWVEICGGTAYCFPLYSSALKSVLGFNQQQLTLLGFGVDVGEAVGILPGIACNKFAPWVVLVVGVFACFFGYGVIWLAVSRIISAPPYWLRWKHRRGKGAAAPPLWIALTVGSNSNAWFGTAVLVTNMRNFPLTRGTVSGILKGYVGVSAAVYTVLYTSLLEQSATRLLLFLTLGLPAICLALMYFIRPCAPPSGEDSSVHGHFIFTQVASVLLGLYLLALTVLYDKVAVSDSVSYALLAVVLVFLLSPLGIPIKMTLFRSNSVSITPLAGSTEHLASEEGNSTLAVPLLLSQSPSASKLESLSENEYASDVETLLAMGEGAVRKKRRPRRGEDFTLRQAFVKADFWLLWVVYFLGVGSGVTVLNNLAQLGVAFGVDDTTILLALFGFCNFAGRLGAGALSEHFVRTRTVPRTFWMTCSLIVMLFAFLLYAFAFHIATLYVSTALVGVCYGFDYSLMVPTASELFGLEHFGIIYNFVLMGNPVGALLFSGLFAGYIYDAEAAKQGSTTCIGPECFRLTFLVLAGFCSLGTILSIYLTIRIRPVYQTLYASGSFRLPRSSVQ